MTAGRAIPLVAAVALVLTGIGTERAHRAGWRLNFTGSEPRGLYQLEPIRAVLARGALVALCPPAWVTPAAFPFYMTGTCPGGGRALLKTLVGIPGDRIDASTVGVRINGVLLADSAAKRVSNRYPEIRLPNWRGVIVLGKGQYWVYGSGARLRLAALSFDSRYFGPVSTSQFRGLVINGPTFISSSTASKESQCTSEPCSARCRP